DFTPVFHGEDGRPNPGSGKRTDCRAGRSRATAAAKRAVCGNVRAAGGKLPVNEEGKGYGNSTIVLAKSRRGAGIDVGPHPWSEAPAGRGGVASCRTAPRAIALLRAFGGAHLDPGGEQAALRGA